MQEQKQAEAEAATERVAIVDGSNVAHSTEGAAPRLENIMVVCEKLRADGYQPIVVVDAALRHEIDERAEFERLLDSGAIRQTPAGTDADYFILSFARELEAAVVSNDRFRDRKSAFSDVTDRLIRYMILNGEVVFEKRVHRRKD